MKNSMSRIHQERLIQNLTRTLQKEGSEVHVFETHISWVLVAGKFAYKFKKALQFDFLDFSTLDARHFYCQEEYRLNRHLAPNLYLGVVAVTGDMECPVIDGHGIAFEYAVKMHAFPQQALWSYRLQMGYLSEMEVDALAGKVAQFHQAAACASTSSQWGNPDLLQKIAADNLGLISTLAKDPEQLSRMAVIEAWHTAQYRTLIDAFRSRKTGGMIKECHGDLHAGNILTLSTGVEVFDCIEFSASLRWIDVMNDIGFIYMDLDFHERPDLAARLLNQYLEITGDYEGVRVLRYYQIERALVRCKIALMRFTQCNAEGREAASYRRQADHYLRYSAERSRSSPVTIIITHGYSGSGKSSFSRCLVELIGAVQIRSDVERKRSHGLSAASRAFAAPGSELYGSAVTERTYDRLCELARPVVESGLPVIVDAAFLKVAQRKLFADLAQELDIPFFILDMQASESTLKQRIESRALMGQDPSDAGLEVLAHQLAEHDPLTADEAKHTIAVDCESSMDIEHIRKLASPIMRVIQSN